MKFVTGCNEFGLKRMKKITDPQLRAENKQKLGAYLNIDEEKEFSEKDFQ